MTGDHVTLTKPDETSPPRPAVSCEQAGRVLTEVIERIDPAVEAQVGAYLSAAPRDHGACPEHDPRWLAVLRSGLGHRTFMVIARRQVATTDPPGAGRGGPICGYLPLAMVSSHLFGRFLVSLPYLNRAGVVADDPFIAAALIDEAVDLADRFDVKYLELRHHGGVVEHRALGKRVDEKVRMVLDLPDDPEFLWANLHSKVRNQVRKGDKSGLEIKWGGLDLLDDFYGVFAVNMRDLGTPVYPRQLFAQVLDQFADEAELAVVGHAGRPIAGALLVHGGGSTQVPSASSLRRFNHTNANMWMYYRLLVRAIERGSRAFDFGRSSVGSGTYRFKKQWGATERPTVWQYHERRGCAGDVRPDSPRYRRCIDIWQRLPVWVTRMVGPAIVRGIP